jgi:hypothetical protein
MGIHSSRDLEPDEVVVDSAQTFPNEMEGQTEYTDADDQQDK